MKIPRLLWAVSAAPLVVLLIIVCVQRGWWAAGIVVIFAVLPDIALLGAFAERGRLKPARVGLYNLLHAVPIALGLSSLGMILQILGLDAWWLTVAGLAWLAHIAVDRLCGYGLRAEDGSILPVGA
ncbi:MAG: DUF4260 family protein [Leucobacter sp.]